jgi:transcriptional regulator with XRE-family HTH domain
MASEPAGRQNGPAIRALRVKEGLTVRELAEMVGLHEQALRNIENGSRPASDLVITAIAHVLAIPTGAITRDGRGVTAVQETPAPERNGAAA